MHSYKNKLLKMNLDTRKFEGWPSKNCHPVMRLTDEPDTLSIKFGLAFESGKDDLDDYSASHFHDALIGSVVLIRHTNAPQSGTPVYVDSTIEAASAIKRISEILNLGSDDINWKVEIQSE